MFPLCHKNFVHMGHIVRAHMVVQMGKWVCKVCPIFGAGRTWATWLLTSSTLKLPARMVIAARRRGRMTVASDNRDYSVRRSIGAYRVERGSLCNWSPTTNAMPATTQRLRALSAKYSDKWSTHAFKMEYDGYLSNHLLHALSALVDLGANDKTIDAYAESYVQKLCVVTDRTRDELAPSVLVAEAPSLLGKRQNFEGLRTMYEAEIKQLTADGAVTRHLPTLVGGLAGSLLHGIIQLGYAYHVGGDLLIAEGLAYLHFSHLSFDKPTEETTTNEIPPESLLKFTRETALELIRRVQRDQTLLSEMTQHIHTPAFSTLVQGNLQRRLMSFSSDPKVGNPKLFNAIASTVDQYDFTGVNGAFVMDFALWLYAIVPHNDFVLLHATTSAWSLQQVEHLLSVDDRERAWKTWFRMALSAFIMHEVPELPPTDPFAAVDDTELASLPSWDQLITQTLALEGEVDEHVYKLVQVAHVVALDAADQQKPQSSFLTSAQREFVLKSAAQKVISTEFWEPASGSAYVTANDAPH